MTIAQINVHIDFSEDMKNWFEKSRDHIPKESNYFFQNNYKALDSLFIITSKPIIDSFFIGAGWPDSELPSIKVIKSDLGSLAIFAVVEVAAGVCKTIEFISNWDKTRVGLRRTGEIVRDEYIKNVTDVLKDELLDITDPQGVIDSSKLPPIPENPIEGTCDIIPESSERQNITISKRSQLSIAINKDLFAIENLGDEEKEDVHINIFKGTSDPKIFTEYRSIFIPVLPPHRWVKVRINEFTDKEANPLIFNINDPTANICSIKTSNEQHLFSFVL